MLQETAPDVLAVLTAGQAYHQAGRLTEAATCLRRVVACVPGFAEAHCALGSVLRDQGLLEQAIACHRRAIELRPDYIQAHNNLGAAYREFGRLEDAIASCRRAVALGPAFPQPHINLGNALRDQGRLDEAIACHRTALRLAPDSAEMHTNLGAALAEHGELEAACTHYRQALILAPHIPETHDNLGIALAEQRRLDEAITCYRTAISLRPDFAEAHFHLALALLTQGELTAGWQEYEWRWRGPQKRGMRHDLRRPLWRGEPASGQTLLVHAEQGFGDTLQFCRYATLAAEQGLRVILEVQQPLVRLLRGLKGVAHVVARGDKLPAFDLHCPMTSMPLALGTTLATIPQPGAYLHADPGEVSAWARRLAAGVAPGPRIGLVWAGNPLRSEPVRAAVDRRRSVAPDRLAPLMAVAGAQFFSLQKDPAEAPTAFGLIDHMGEMQDFADTAALVANLDLVISVDTAMVHLAAALGRPVWMMDRFDACWRWLTDRSDSPWYPSLRLYRQPAPGAWQPVIAAIGHDLTALTEAAIRPA